MNGAPSTLVSPGLWGFAAFFFLAVALWLLMWNMNARMRRMSLRARARQEELEARVRGDHAADEATPGSDRSDAGTPEADVDADDHIGHGADDVRGAGRETSTDDPEGRGT